MKRYYATNDIAISGVENKEGRPLYFRAGEELVGVPAKRIPNLLALKQAVEMEDPERPQITPPAQPVVQQNKPIEQPRKAGGK